MASTNYARYAGIGGGGGGTGTVTNVSVVSANGFAGTVTNPTTTPAITLSTTITGLLQGNGTAISAATTGNLTDVGTDGITITNGTGAVLGSGTQIAQAAASATQNGYLTSANFSIFNGKQAAGNYITGLTGDVTATGPGSVAATLATVNSNVGSFGSNTGIPSFTVNAKGLITAASNNAVATSPAASTVAAWDANKNLSANAQFGAFATTATAATTTTLTTSSAQIQAFTGSTTQTVLLPTTGVATGMTWTIYNLSTGVVTVEASGGGTIQAMAANTFLEVTANAATPTTAAGWYWNYGAADSAALPVAAGGTGSTTQNFVDLTTAQTVAGSKTFSTAPTFSSLTTAGVLLNSAAGVVSSSAGALAVANGGTAKTSVTTAPAASSWAGWDANKNFSSNTFIPGFTTTATAGGSTTLTIASTQTQEFTGSTTQTVLLPTTSIVAGSQYFIVNKSTGVVTVEASGGGTIQAMAANTAAFFTANAATPTTAAGWDYYYVSINAPATPTNAYYSGSMPNATTWSTSSTTLVDPTVSGSNTLTQRKSRGITVSAAASNLPGITFTPPSTTSAYIVTAVFESSVSSSSGAWNTFSLYDGTTVIQQCSVGLQTTSVCAPAVTLNGIYVPGVTSAVTVKIQMATNSSSGSIGASGTIAPSIEWALVQIA